jgi:hypothetical protein
MPPTDADFQTRTLGAYTVLQALRPGVAVNDAAWPGALILNLGLDPCGAAVSLAANIAGAVCLSLESDPALLRNALRAGSCDFVVNTLDEALRAIKNEVRKRRPLSVGLEGNASTLLGEIVERGVAPELFTGSASHPEAAAHFRVLGAPIVPFDDSAPEGLSAASVLEAFLSTHPWQLRTFTFPTAAELRAFDARALSLLSAEDRLRRQWLVSAARVFPRERQRVLWLSEEEAQALGRISG